MKKITSKTVTMAAAALMIMSVLTGCSGVEKINFIAGGVIGGSETILSHELKGNETYIRIECVDEKGRTAWTNPLWL